MICLYILTYIPIRRQIRDEITPCGGFSCRFATYLLIHWIRPGQQRPHSFEDKTNASPAKPQTRADSSGANSQASPKKFRMVSQKSPKLEAIVLINRLSRKILNQFPSIPSVYSGFLSVVKTNFASVFAAELKRF